MLPPRARRALRLPLGRRRVEKETDDEIQFHLAMRVEALVASGLGRAEAEAEALRRFGVLDEVRPQLLAAARHREEKLTMFERIDALRDDVRYAFRQLRRSPGFSAALAVTFALGIGANATMFEILDRLLFRPPAYMPDADRVGRIYLRRPRPDGTERIDNNISYLRYTEMRDHTRAFAASAAVYQDDQRIVGTGTSAEALGVGLVSASFWSLFDAPAALGRYFTSAEDEPPRGTNVVVLAYGYWRSRFAGDPAVLGRTLRVGGMQFTIIGVAPNGFNGIWATTTSVYIPITAAAYDMLGSDRYYREHNASWLEMIARLKPGVTPEVANAELTRAYRQSRMDAAATGPASARVSEQDLALTRGEFAPLPMDRGPKRSGSAKVATWLAGVAAIVLLIACANVANLLIARGIARRREIAVRIALGVSRSRLVAQVLTESLVIAALGGVLGLAVAHWGGGAIRRVLLPDVDWSLVPAFDPRVVLFTAGVVMVTGALTGLAPATHALRADVNGSLKAGQREGGGQRSRLRTGLLIAQAALSVVLLVGAALFVRSLHNVESLDLGWDPSRLLVVDLEFRGTGLTSQQQRDLIQRTVEKVRQRPGIVAASTLFSVPFWRTWSDDVFVPGMDSSDHQRLFVVNPVGDDYFRTMGTHLLRGRAVSSRDLPTGPPVAVISESLGRLLWKGAEPLGRCLRVGADTAPCREVVGIAQDITFGDIQGDRAGLEIYLPLTQEPMKSAIILRTAADPGTVAEPIRQEMQSMLPAMGFARTRPLASVLDSVTRQWTLGATMFTIFGLLAVLLAAVGLYGVIAYDIAQRVRELGVRVALGARARDIRRLVLWQGMRVTAVGIALGGVVAFLAVRYVEKLLFATPARDPIAFGVAIVTLFAVGVIASLVPAIRATRVDPVIALRAD